MKNLVLLFVALCVAFAIAGCDPGVIRNQSSPQKTPAQNASSPGAASSGVGVLSVPMGSHWVRDVQGAEHRCLDIPRGTQEQEARVQIWDCTSSNTWQLLDITWDAGEYKLQFAHSHQCLEPAEDGQGDEKPLQQFPCNNNAKQRWRIERFGGGYHIINVLSGKCVDVWHESTGNGSRVNQHECLPNQVNQQFTFQPDLPPPPTPTHPPTPTPTPAVPPIETKKICFNQPIPTGWILINKYTEHLEGCNDNPKFNVSEIRRIDNRPAGEMLIACLGDVPPGWKLLGKNIDRTKCGYRAGSANNVMNIQKQ
jgi:hypothetical protein